MLQATVPQSGTDFNAIRISLASPEQILTWSYGEVTKPETINYRTLRPERDGLFCERIFGPQKDWECACGKYKKIRFKGVTCERCGVEVTRAKVRRERMGHIKLAAPVAHIWFSRGIPSRIGLLLDLSPRNLERILYFAQHVITEVDDDARKHALQQLEKEYKEQEAKAGESALTEGGDAQTHGERIKKQQARLQEEYESRVDELQELRPLRLLVEVRHRELKERYPGVFKAGMGAEAIVELLRQLDLNALREQLFHEMRTTSGQRYRKAIKRLKVVNAFLKSGNKPEWMILAMLPVLPPELRPMVQLDGGRFATSDLNDLYRRVINRNNRLQRLLELEAPEIIIRNEKRMLQEAVDALIDNGRHGRIVTGSHNHKLKSLSDLLRGKQGRFRQNLLGKRVDYSGRSVIVVGPELQLHQCGLPKRMALELFKPFVMHRLVAKGLAHNIRSAKRSVERVRPEVWDILEEVIKDRPVLLNRAPTLHRLGVQAFMPVLIEGSAIQIHPLVCTAFNADFDGDQMAVHVPLSREAVFEAKELMLSANNLLSPASGEPVVTPTLDLVLGIYYLTSSDPQAIGHDRRFGSVSEALLACDLGLIRSQASIQVLERDIEGASGRWIITTAGRLIFRGVLPKELTDDPANWNRIMDKKAIKDLVTTSYHLLGAQATAAMLDSFKKLGFHYATLSGTSIGIHDLEVPERKKELVAKAERQIQQLEEQYQGGLVSEKERYEQAIRIWTEASDTMTKVIEESLPTFGGIFTIAASGAKGNISQITQMAGMRGLMSDPKGRLIEVPVRSSFREGLSVLEYFISTHGARKGLADTALRTADSGYLTRRMVDVAQDMIILEEDCATTLGSWIRHDQEKEKNNYIATFRERLVGRYAAEPIADPSSGEILVGRNEEIGEDMAARIWDQGIREVYVRSPLTCEARRGLCAPCYGRMPASGKLAQVGEAVGVVAAESIGEPGTQLTMRTFHTGGVSGVDITSGIPRVEGLFEARVPKNCAILAEIDGMVTIAEKPEGWQLQLVSAEEYREEYPILPKYRVVVKRGEAVEAGTPLAVPRQAAKKAEPTKKAKTKASSSEIQPAIVAKVAGRIELTTGKIAVVWQERDERVYLASMTAHILVKSGDAVKAGQELTAGPKDPHDILRIQGREAVEQYIIEEIQKVYRSQGVSINDKHIEIIIRQMLRRVRVDYAGDTDLLPDDLVDRIEFEDINRRILAQGGEPARATPRLLGITRSSLNTDSFLAAASFQETTRVLTEAALNGQIDRLHGLKENVILGRLLPARYPIPPDVKPWGDGKDKEPLAIASTATALDDEGASAQMLATLELPSDE